MDSKRVHPHRIPIEALRECILIINANIDAFKDVRDLTGREDAAGQVAQICISMFQPLDACAFA